MSARTVSVRDIQSLYLFNGLPAGLCELIAVNTTFMEVDGGAPVFRRGEPITRFYHVEQGYVQLSRSSARGDQKVIAVMNAGETFGEALMFADSGVYPVDAHAIGNTRLLAFATQPMMEALRASPDACFAVMTSMSQRLHQLVQQIEEITLHNATHRLVAYLLDQVPAGAETARDIQLKLPKLVIASHLSIQPETFSRILKRMRDRGLIESDGAHIVLHDAAALERLLEA